VLLLVQQPFSSDVTVSISEHKYGLSVQTKKIHSVLQTFLSSNTNFVTEVLSQSLTQNGTQLTGATAFVRTNIWGRGSRVEMKTSYVTQRTARVLCAVYRFIALCRRQRLV